PRSVRGLVQAVFTHVIVRAPPTAPPRGPVPHRVDHEGNVMIDGFWRGFRRDRLLWRAPVVVGGRPSRRPGRRAPFRSGWRSPLAPPLARITYTHQQRTIGAAVSATSSRNRDHGWQRAGRSASSEQK